MEYTAKQLKRLKRLRRRKNIAPAILKLKTSDSGSSRSHRGLVVGLTALCDEKGNWNKQ